MPTPPRQVGNNALNLLRQIDEAARESSSIARLAAGRLNNPDYVERSLLEIRNYQELIQRLALAIATGRERI